MGAVSTPHVNESLQQSGPGLSAAAIDAAAARIEPAVAHTPLEAAPRISRDVGAQVYLKREDLQTVRSYKIRGAYNVMAQLSPQERSRGVVAASAGNHAQGVAYACRTMFHDGALWVFGSIYPRPYCDYAVTPVRPTKILELSVPTNLYCVTEDPNQQIRGSANAPRPPGDDTAGPPPNYDPNARTVPLDK